MKKYFLHNGINNEGPFDLEDLKSKAVDPSTPIWFEGLTQWSTAAEIEELKDILEITPPPFLKRNEQISALQNKQIINSAPKSKNRNWAWRFLILASIVVVAYPSG